MPSERPTLKQQVSERCVHFNGTQNDRCEAGVAYKDLVGNEAGCSLKLPCLRSAYWLERSKEVGGMVECSLLRFPTEEEAQKEADEDEARIAEFLGAIRRGECPICKRPVRQQQVGPCVYGDCGHRLYQGKVVHHGK